jgi:hypothetical protein
MQSERRHDGDAGRRRGDCFHAGPVDSARVAPGHGHRGVEIHGGPRRMTATPSPERSSGRLVDVMRPKVVLSMAALRWLRAHIRGLSIAVMSTGSAGS